MTIVAHRSVRKRQKRERFARNPSAGTDGPRVSLHPYQDGWSWRYVGVTNHELVVDRKYTALIRRKDVYFKLIIVRNIMYLIYIPFNVFDVVISIDRDN